MGGARFGGPEGRAMRRCLCDDVDAPMDDVDASMDDVDMPMDGVDATGYSTCANMHVLISHLYACTVGGTVTAVVLVCKLKARYLHVDHC